MEGNEMKTIFSSLGVLLVMLVFAPTASAIPTPDFSALNAQSTTNQHTGSRWHAISRSIRDFEQRKIEASLIGVDDSLEFDPVTEITADNHNGSLVRERDGYRHGKDNNVDVAEPALVALIALGLVGFGFVGRKRNH